MLADLKKRITKRRSLNRKEIIKEGTVEYHKRRKNTVSQNMSKYNIFSFLS